MAGSGTSPLFLNSRCDFSRIWVSIIKAHPEKRAILTFDLDFGEIASFSAGRIVSVIVFRLHNTRTPHVIDQLQSALMHREVLENGAIIVDEETRCRVRQLPIGHP